ncbi:MAG: glycosyltransferase family 2 protein [Candidatus Falkowbacteria bacterium]
MKVFCVIPAYNEEETINKVIDQVKKIVDKVIVVDDCSSDKTYKIAKNHKEVAVLKHIINRGQGASLQTGNEYALKNNADVVVHFDADGQFLAREIKDVISPIINNKADVVFGSRFLEKKSDIPWFKEKVIINLARLVNRFFLKVNLTDPQSGFRAFSQKALRKIKIENDGMAHCSEILAKVFENNFRVKEIPITVIYYNFGQRFNGGLKIIKDLILGKLVN